MPDNKGRFHLYSNTSKFATGNVCYQIQNGQPRLIAYGSKRVLSAAQNYSITELELELCGLAINVASFLFSLFSQLPYPYLSIKIRGDR